MKRNLSAGQRAAGRRLEEIERDTAEPEENTAQPNFIDLRPHLTGTVKQEVPTVANMGNGIRLFYAGRLNEVHGEPGTGKSNVLIAAACSVARDGGTVIYIDPEDTPAGFVRRALGLGFKPPEIATIKYLHNPSGEEIATAQRWAEENKPTLVVLDGVAEALVAEGLDENSVPDVLGFFRERIRPFADLGAAVVLADHVVKNGETRGAWQRGTSAKMGRYDGLVLAVETAAPYTPTRPGKILLRICKDRNGGAGPKGSVFAEVSFTPNDNGFTEIEFTKPQLSKEFRPTATMDKIVEHLKLFPGATKRSVCESVRAKRVCVIEAINLLIKEGAIRAEPSGQSHRLFLVKTA
jgi:hypothetical protein